MAIAMSRRGTADWSKTRQRIRLQIRLIRVAVRTEGRRRHRSHRADLARRSRELLAPLKTQVAGDRELQEAWLAARADVEALGREAPDQSVDPIQ